MRLECRSRGGVPRLQTGRSSSIDSNDEDIRIRLDDPSLRLNLNDSPSPPNSADHLIEHHLQHFQQHGIGDSGDSISCTSPNLKNKTIDLDTNMNAHTPSLNNSTHLDQSAPSHV